MKQLTAEALREHATYDPETGVFIANKAYGKRLPGRALGRNSNGYLMISVNGGQYLAHRLAWLYMTGAWPQHEIDHINVIRNDNRWLNLRDVSHRINTQNVHKAYGHNKSSGVLGVSWHRGAQRWHVRLKVGAKQHWIGYFDDIPSAKSAYDDARARLR